MNSATLKHVFHTTTLFNLAWRQSTEEKESSSKICCLYAAHLSSVSRSHRLEVIGVKKKS